MRRLWKQLSKMTKKCGQCKSEESSGTLYKCMDGIYRCQSCIDIAIDNYYDSD